MNNTYLVWVLVLGLIQIVSAQPQLSGYSNYINASLGGPRANRYYGIYYTVTLNSIRVGLVCQTDNTDDYCAFGISPSGYMLESRVVVSWINRTGNPNTEQYHLGGKNPPQKSSCEDGGTLSLLSVCPDTSRWKEGCCNNAKLGDATYNSPYLSINYILPLSKNDPCDLEIPVGTPINFVYAIGNTDSVNTWPYAILTHFSYTRVRPYNITLRTDQNVMDTLVTCNTNAGSVSYITKSNLSVVLLLVLYIFGL
eukprot:TRINITY_DN7079_c0_g1_i1.p1 TRINITY_DN7079_c0_g1~~TRINITY_DN7079_c0_g1_i1.p1  ORF type:complete len:253 (-),score=11.88 TRINITY_DN7079_c0_g1_i1:17-775(-)